jgi:hypothetical protein
MADLAIGLSKKVVDGLVKKVDDAIKEEKELWQTVERDSVFIRDELEMMKSFLKTADRDRVRSSVVRTWVMQVRDLSYHAEDSIEGILELEPQRPWWALPFLPRVLPPCCRPRVGRALDEEVDKIKLIKARVEEVSQRNLRYNLINTIGSGQLQQAPIPAMDLDLAKVQEGSFRLRCLLGYLTRHGGLSVISVWGTGGNLGTISIIRNMFDRQSICSMFKCRARVKLMHPFIPQKFLGDLIAQLLTNSGFTCGDDVRSKKVEDLVKEVEQLVMGRGYLLVLEDLSNMEDWYSIKTYLPDLNGNGNCVIVSTQLRQIARLCIGQHQNVREEEVGQLSADDRVYAFFAEIRIPSEAVSIIVSIYLLSLYLRFKRSHHVRRQGLEILTLI